jgi:hypothetical protein
MDATSRPDSARRAPGIGPKTQAKSPKKDARKWQHFDRLMCDPTVSSGPKLVGYRLAWHHNSDTGQCSPSYDLIAKFTGLSRRSVIRYAADLVVVGWLLSIQNRHNGHQATNQFEFNWDWKPSVEIPELRVTSMSPRQGDIRVTHVRAKSADQGDKLGTTRVTNQVDQGDTAVTHNKESDQGKTQEKDTHTSCVGADAPPVDARVVDFEEARQAKRSPPGEPTSPSATEIADRLEQTIAAAKADADRREQELAADMFDPPTKPPAESKKKPAKKRGHPKRPIPEGWQPTGSAITKLIRFGYTRVQLDQQVIAYIGHAKANGRVLADWDQGFVNWVTHPTYGIKPGVGFQGRFDDDRRRPIQKPTVADSIAAAGESFMRSVS